MKNLLLCTTALIFLISCSADSDFDKSGNVKKQSLETDISEFPANNRNHYDSIGKEFYKTLNLYYAEKQFPNSINEISNQIKFISFNITKNSNTSKLIVFNDEIVEAIMSDPDNMMITIVQNSSLGISAKTNLINFLQTLIIQRQEEFNVIYEFIVSYENTVVDNNALSDDEKETLLSVTSISRYSLYSESERKDRDWEKNVGSKTAKPFFAENQVSLVSLIALLGKFL